MTFLAHIETSPAESLSLLPVYLAGIAIAIQCALVSVFVVLRKMSFVGHGISHAALAGVGVGAILGWTGSPMLVLVGLTCVGASLAMVLLTRTTGAHAEHDDTAIGIVLGAFMALGAVLLAWRASHPIEGIETDLHWEEVLFGSINDVGTTGAWLAWLSCLAVGIVTYASRRAMMLWVYDPTSARLAGVRDGAVQLILMAMITAIIIVSVRLAGVVLVTTMLILPGAIALRLSGQLGRVVILSVVSSVVGMVAGIAIAQWLGLPPGACVILVTTALYGGIRIVGR